MNGLQFHFYNFMQTFDFVVGGNLPKYINLSSESIEEAVEASKESEVIHIPIVNLTPGKVTIPVRYVSEETIEAVEKCLDRDIDGVRYNMIRQIYRLISE